MAAIRAVLVDWAGTMTRPLRDVVLDAVRSAELDQDQLREAFAGLAAYVTSTDTPIHRAERGEISDAELIDWLEQTSPGARAVFDVESPASIFHAEDRPEMVDALRRLRRHDVRLVLATNNFASAQPILERRYRQSELVDEIVNSALVRCRKPETAFWEHCLLAAGLPPAAEVALLDDTEANVDAARQHGLTAILVGDDPTEALEQLWEVLRP